MSKNLLIAEKIKQAVALLNEFDLDCWLTFVRESGINGDPALTYLSETTLTWHSAFFIHRDGETHAIVGRYDVPSIEALGVYDKVTGFVEGIKTPFIEHIKRKNPAKIGINFSKGSEICDGLTTGMYFTLQDLLTEAGDGVEKRLVSAERMVSALRERKSAQELECIKSATAITEKIWNELAEFIKPSLKEKEVADFVHERIKYYDCEPAWEASSCPAVFSGIGIAEAHFAPGNKLLQKGELVNIDFGVRKNGYVSDMQRVFYLLDDNETSAPPEVQHGFDTIVNAIQAAKDGMKAGVQAYTIDAIARNMVTEAGYDEFAAGLGHQLGKFVHDGTALMGPLWEKYAQKPLQLLEKNMVFTIEPRVKIPQRGIVSIEEMVVVTDSGAEWLCPPQKELILIAAK